MANKEPQITLNELAAMVADGFANTATKESVEELKVDVRQLKVDVRQLKSDMLDVKLRLDNVPCRFEMTEQEKRIEKLEEKARK